jgi:plasmid stabilization system protein ParE
MSTPNRPSQGPQQNPDQNERMSALEGIKSQLANLRRAVERPQAQSETAETAPDAVAASEALDALATAFETARAQHANLAPNDDANQMWKNVEQALLDSTEGLPISPEALMQGIEDTDAAQVELANLAGDIFDEESTVQEYLDRFRLSPTQRIGAAIDRGIDRARENPELGPVVQKVEGLFRSLGINFDDVKSFLKSMFIQRLEEFPFRVGLVEDARFQEQMKGLTEAQRKTIVDLKIAQPPRDIEGEYRSAYSSWAGLPITAPRENPTALSRQTQKRPRIVFNNGEPEIDDGDRPPLQAEQTTAVPQQNVFGITGLNVNQPMRMEGRAEFPLQVAGAGTGLTLGEITRGGKRFSLAYKNNPDGRITINTLTAKNATDPGQIEVQLSTGETIKLIDLTNHLQRAIAENTDGGDAIVEFTTGTTSIIATGK